MTHRLSQVPTVSLCHLFGAPATALVEAESQAIRATVDFIEKLGFEGGETGRGMAEPAGTPPRLRMTAFRHAVTNADGQRQVHEVQIPSLSLVPIPSLQINTATLEFAVRIVDMRVIPASAPAAKEPRIYGKREGRLDLRAQMGSLDGLAKGTCNGHLRLTMTVGRSDVPAGLSQLFQLMDQSTASQIVEESRRPIPCGC